MMCRSAPAVGVYVLGALDPGERARLESHFAKCPVCQAELARVADLPRLLGRLSRYEVERLPNPPPTKGAADGLVDLVRRGRRRRRHRMLGVAAAVAAVVIVIAVAAVGTTRLPVPVSSPGAAATLLRAENPANHVTAAITLASRESGTEVSVVFAGVGDDRVCQLIARDRDGHSEVAGTWKASHRGAVMVPGSVAIPTARLAELDILSVGGPTLLSVPIHF